MMRRGEVTTQVCPNFLGKLSVRLAAALRGLDLAAGQGRGLEHAFATESRLMIWLPLTLPFGSDPSGLATDLFASVHVISTPIVSLSRHNQRHRLHYK